MAAVNPGAPIQQQLWHALDRDTALSRLAASASGLSESEVRSRRALYGPNQLPAVSPVSPLIRFVAQFRNVLVYVLIGAALIVLMLGHVLDAAIIVAVTLINALIGYVQEGRAEKAIEAIRGMLAPAAVVMRAGTRSTVPVSEVVPGDIVRVESGDRVPADLRLIEVHSLSVDESALTGESVPVGKSIAPTAEFAPLAERSSMAYSGTLVTRGQALGVVVATGLATEVGHVTSLVAAVEPLQTPLLAKLERFGRTLMFSILIAAATVFLVGAVRGRDLGETFLAVVGIAVAAVPEGLPAIITVALAIGVQRMARRNAIVRQLPAVETLGAVTVICTDKTGTLTRNEMTPRRVTTRAASYQVSESSLLSNDQLESSSIRNDAAADESLILLGRAAVLCNDARLIEADGTPGIDGDPTEGALLVLAQKLGMDIEAERLQAPRTHVIPFESDLRYMATQHGFASDAAVAFVKGAPETVIALCSFEADGRAPIDVDWWRVRVHSMARDGMRVLGLAMRVLTPGEVIEATSIGRFSLLGLIGLIDPPRDEALRAVRDCQSARIRVKMITGDHAETAMAIALQLGIGDGRVVLGSEIEGLGADQLAALVRSADVFARTRPEHKLRLVEALQSQGEVVAMTGDGVNDAPALKRADVGVAMGRKGTEAAKEAADVVLADDNFVSIAQAVEEGRAVYDNVRKAILYILPTNGSEAMVLILAIVLGITIPITPVQILWVNLVTEVTLSLTIAFHAPEPALMRRQPRPVDEALMDRMLVWRTLLVTAVLTAGVIALFYWQLNRTGSEMAARTLAVNALVVGEIFYLFNMRSLTRSSLTLKAWTADPITWGAIAFLVVVQLLFTYAPWFQEVFATAGIDTEAWLAAIALGIAVFLLVEAEKHLRSRRVEIGPSRGFSASHG